MYKPVSLSLTLAFIALTSHLIIFFPPLSFVSHSYHHSPVQNKLPYGFPLWSARAASICYNRVSSQETDTLLYKGYNMICVRNSAKKLHTSLLVTLVVTNKASTYWNSSFRNGAYVSLWLRKKYGYYCYFLSIYLFQKLILEVRKKK